MALKADKFAKVADDTSALCGYISNKILPLKIDMIPLPYKGLPLKRYYCPIIFGGLLNTKEG